MLTDDAAPVVLLGQRPVVMDPFSFKVLVESGKIDARPLVERIDRQEFNALVLERRIEDPNDRLAAFTSARK